MTVHSFYFRDRDTIKLIIRHLLFFLSPVICYFLLNEKGQFILFVVVSQLVLQEIISGTGRTIVVVFRDTETLVDIHYPLHLFCVVCMLSNFLRKYVLLTSEYMHYVENVEPECYYFVLPVLFYLYMLP